MFQLIAPLLTTYEKDIDEMLDSIRRSMQRQASRLGNGALDKSLFSESFRLMNTMMLAKKNQKLFAEHVLDYCHLQQQIVPILVNHYLPVGTRH